MLLSGITKEGLVDLLSYGSSVVHKLRMRCGGSRNPTRELHQRNRIIEYALSPK